MSGLFVLPSDSSPKKPRRPLARGTKTAEIESRQVRLHSSGDKPWAGREDDHRDQINVEVHDGTYVVFKPSVGALSALAPRDLVPFHVFVEAGGDREALQRYYVQMGETEERAKIRTKRLADKLVRDGWTRTELPDQDAPPLASVYFTVTRWCDLGCPYCYQGLNDRVHTEMSMDQARLALERIKAVNPEAQLNVTGGEPFSHSRIFDILDMIEDFGFSFMILSNGSFIDDEAAAHLKSLKGFLYIQISLDGATAEVHEFTRGKGSFPKVMAGIRSVIDQALPFKLAPTVHDGNMHELAAIGELALGNGGWMSPNQLIELPHSGLDYTNLTMSHDRLVQVLRELNAHLIAKFGLETVAELSRRYRFADPEVCSVAQPNSTFICGMAHSLMDIDWNGDVYPCHLSKGPDLKLGNIFEEDFPAIFQKVEDRGLRVKSHEIEQCSGCKFVSNCAGGCRAGAWFTYGTLEHPDPLCDANYASNLRRLLVGAGVA